VQVTVLVPWSLLRASLFGACMHFSSVVGQPIEALDRLEKSELVRVWILSTPAREERVACLSG